MASNVAIGRMFALFKRRWIPQDKQGQPDLRYDTKAMEMFAAILADIPDEVVDAATLQYLANPSPFFPGPGEIRAIALGILSNQAGIPAASEAWGEVCEMMRYAKPERCPDFSHKVIKRAVKAVGGWWELCNSTNATADRARFLEAYREIVSRDQEQARILPAVRAMSERLQIEEPERLRLKAGE